jgi:hypothetical protein
MGNGMLSQWRRGMVARGVATAGLLAVPVIVAAAIGYEGTLSGLYDGLDAVVSGPETTQGAPALSAAAGSEPGGAGGAAGAAGTPGTAGGGGGTGGNGGANNPTGGGTGGGSGSTLDLPNVVDEPTGVGDGLGLGGGGGGSGGGNTPGGGGSSGGGVVGGAVETVGGVACALLRCPKSTGRE